jgi:hypothetical protein
MRRAALIAALVLAATPAAALAQTALDGASSPGSRPQPLWVPDPEPNDEAAGDVSANAVEVAAPVAVTSAVADDPSRLAVAHWMAAAAREAGLPGELPVMASLVESGLRNLSYGDADSVGFFQMRQGIWNQGVYAGYLVRPELQLRWFFDHALAVRDARRAAGDIAFGEDAATWGDWIADIEQPYGPYRGRYAQRLDEARTLLALPAPPIASFELGLTVGGPAAPVVDPAADELAQRVLADPEITLDPRASSDLASGDVDPRVSAVLLDAATHAPISIWVIHTGHSYYVAGTNRPSNHSFGRAVDIGSVNGEVVSPHNEAAHELALAIGRLPASIRPTEIGSPWAIDEPEYFTNAAHQDHIHVGFDDPAGADAAASAAAAEPLDVSAVPVAPRRSSPRAEPRFEAGGGSGAGKGDEPGFEVGG